MGKKVKKKSAPGRKEMEVLGATFAEGKPDGETEGNWRQKLDDREAKLKYLETGERYWFGKEWFGSEKRKNPA
jgi:hypothetical protein